MPQIELADYELQFIIECCDSCKGFMEIMGTPLSPLSLSIFQKLEDALNKE